MLSALSLLLAVTSAVQVTAAPAPRKPKRVRPPVSTTIMTAPLAESQASLEAAAAGLEMAQPDFAAFSMQAPVFAMAASDLQAAGIALSVAPMALVGPAIATTIAPLPVWWGDDESDDAEIGEPKFQDQSQSDVADSAYRAARQALNRNDYQHAAELFHGIRDRYPRSTSVPNTYYWEAFALYRTGSDDNLRAARTALKAQGDKYPKTTTQRDAQVLLRRVQGELARRGDRDAAESISQDMDDIAPAVAVGTPGVASPVIVATPGRRGRSESCDDDDDLRIAALNAVLQMDPDRAVPLLKTVLDRRDEGSVCLRRKAVFLLSQKRTGATSARRL